MKRPRRISSTYYLAALFGRAWQVRLAAVIIATICLMTVLASSVTDALQLSGMQRANSVLGNSDARIQLPGSAALGQDGSGFDHDLSRAVLKAGGIDTQIDYVASGVQTTNGDETSYILEQIEDPASATNRLSLTTGRWPHSPGEAAVSAEVAGMWPVGSEVSFFSDHLVVRVVGVVNTRFAKDSRTFVLPVGSWTSLSGISDVEASKLDESANRIVRWSGQGKDNDILDAVKKVVAAHTWKSEIASDGSDIYVESRSAIESAPSAINVPLFTATIAGPLLAGLLGGLLASTFTERLRKTMWTVGVSPLHSWRSSTVVIVMASALGATVGAFLGIACGWAMRPILAAIANQDLGPVTSTPLALWCVPLSVLGALASIFVSRRRTEVSSQDSAELGRDRLLFRAAAATVLVSVGIFLGNGSSSAVNVSLTALLVATAIVVVATPGMVSLIGRVTPSSFALRLAFRGISRNAKIHSVSIASIAVLQILGLTVALFVTSSITQINDSSEAQVPPGQISFSPQLDEAIEIARVRTEFERRLGLAEPIIMYTAGAGSDREDGATRVVPSVDALQEIVRIPLSAAQVQLLESGGTLVTKYLSGSSVDFPPTENFLGATVSALELHGVDPSFRNIDGFMLNNAAVKAGFPLLQPQFIYTGIDPATVGTAKQVAIEMSLNPDWVQVNREPDVFVAPLRITMISLLLSLIAAGVILMMAISESRRIRPTLAGLNALGVPRTYISTVLSITVGLSTLIAVVLAFLASVVGVSVGFFLARTNIPVAVPYLAVAIMAGVLITATVFAAWIATRRLRMTEWMP